MTVEVREHQKTPLWRNATVLKWLAQIAVLIGVIALFVTLGSRAAANFSKSDITFGWDWLSNPTGVQIREGIDTFPDSGARALFVGLVNTLRVAISGIIVATILGTLIGIARLSKNWIVNKVATVYIETIRNVPLLVQIFFWSAIAIGLPDLTIDDVGEYWFKASNKGFAFAWIFGRLGCTVAFDHPGHITQPQLGTLHNYLGQVGWRGDGQDVAHLEALLRGVYKSTSARCGSIQET